MVFYSGVSSLTPLVVSSLTKFVLTSYDTGTIGGIIAMQDWLETFGKFDGTPNGLGWYIPTNEKSLVVRLNFLFGPCTNVTGPVLTGVNPFRGYILRRPTGIPHGRQSWTKVGNHCILCCLCSRGWVATGYKVGDFRSRTWYVQLEPFQHQLLTGTERQSLPVLAW